MIRMLSHCSMPVLHPFAKTCMQFDFWKQSWLWYCESLSVQTNNSIKVNAAGKLCVCGCPHSAQCTSTHQWCGESRLKSDVGSTWKLRASVRIFELTPSSQHPRIVSWLSTERICSYRNLKTTRKNVRREFPHRQLPQRALKSLKNISVGLQSGLWVTI